MSDSEEEGAAAPDGSGEAGASDADGDSRFFTHTGPKASVKYPLKIIYCGECSMPVEYCEFHPNYEKCKQWMEKNLPSEMQQLLLAPADGDDKDGDGPKKKRQTRGGRGNVKAKKKAEPQRIALSRASRGKRKYVTVITGLASYEIDLKVASKFLATKFSCGASVTGEDEIVIQGDVKDELFDAITEKWPQIDEENIDDLGDQKR